MAVDIIVDKTKHSDDLDTILKNRLRTQDRNGNDNGGLYFYPSMICTILHNYEKQPGVISKKYGFVNWLNNSLDSVFFNVGCCRKILYSEVESLILESHAICEIGLSLPKATSYKLSTLFPYLTTKQKNKFKVFVKLKRSTQKPLRVNVGTKDNLITGIDDLTIDHIQPISETLKKNASKLKYISLLDAMIRTLKLNSKRDIRQQIPQCIDYNDITAYNELKKELNLIIRETKGLRMIASSVN